MDVSPAPLMQLVDVGKAYAPGQDILRGLNLTLGAGEFVSLLGPSGCGKSTALRLVAGLSRPTAGEVVWSAAPAAGDIGFVFQEPTLLPWARVWENVYLPLRLRGESRDAARPAVEEALALVGLADRPRAFPRELSGGMKMRVSIARALVTRPRVLLMDEPFAALDEITRFRLNDDLLRLWSQQGWSVLFVTHSVYESVYLSQRVLVMAPGPGRVTDQIAIDHPHPRDESFRQTPPYAAACARLSAALRSASTPGTGDGLRSAGSKP